MYIPRPLTLVIFAIVFSLLIVKTKNWKSFPNLAVSFLIPLLGISLYEFHWHVGLGLYASWYRWNGALFWGSYALCVASGIAFVNNWFNLKLIVFNEKRMLGFWMLYLCFVTIFALMYLQGFYPQLVLWDKGEGLNPHGLLWGVTKTLAICFGLVFVKWRRKNGIV